MILRDVIVSAIVILGVGCHSNQKPSTDSAIDTTSVYSCDTPLLKQVYSQRSCVNDRCGYSHYLMLDQYKESCFNEYDFVYFADSYRESAKNDLPIKSIQFLKPFDFVPTGDSEDLAPLRIHSIVQIGYTDSTMDNKIPEIGGISIKQGDVVKALNYLSVSSRQRRMKVK